MSLHPSVTESGVSSPGLGVNDDLKIQSEVTNGQDTVHYISPASTARTENEGDYIYAHFSNVNKNVALTEPTESTLSCDDPQLQRMIVIVRPEAMRFKDVIIRTIKEAGMYIIGGRHLHLTAEQVSELYSQHYGSPQFPRLVISMSNEPVYTMALSGINTIDRFKCLVGANKALHEHWFFPLSMRIKYGLQDMIEQAIHASDNRNEAEKENRFFFPEGILEPISCERNKVEDYCDVYYRDTLVNGLCELVRVKPVEPLIYLAEWLLMNNPYQPRFPYSTTVAAT